MEHQALKLLPFEFARVNRVAVDNERQQLLIGPDAPLWAMTEAIRFTGAKLPVENLPETEFDALLSQIYSGRSGTSESVMEDIKDFVDMESAAADLEDVGDLLDAENDGSSIIVSEPTESQLDKLQGEIIDEEWQSWGSKEYENRDDFMNEMEWGEIEVAVRDSWQSEEITKITKMLK